MPCLHWPTPTSDAVELLQSSQMSGNTVPVYFSSTTTFDSNKIQSHLGVWKVYIPYDCQVVTTVTIRCSDHFVSLIPAIIKIYFSSYS